MNKKIIYFEVYWRNYQHWKESYDHLMLLIFATCEACLTSCGTQPILRINKASGPKKHKGSLATSCANTFASSGTQSILKASNLFNSLITASSTYWWVQGFYFPWNMHQQLELRWYCLLQMMIYNYPIFSANYQPPKALEWSWITTNVDLIDIRCFQ